MRVIVHGLVFLALTAVTQLGGLAWLAALWLRYRTRWPLGLMAAFALTYALTWGTAQVTAPLAGRTPIPCATDAPLRTAHWSLCFMMRNFATPELIALLEDQAQAYRARFPDAQVLVLDSSFPFLDGFPLPPHLSHDDGEKADLAFAYRDPSGAVRPTPPSPVGYFAFEPGPTQCPDRWLTLRWDLDWLQWLWPPHELDEARTAALVQGFLDDPRLGRLLLEPHLQDRLGLSHPKLRFQGCRAARHDDHIHLQL